MPLGHSRSATQEAGLTMKLPTRSHLVLLAGIAALLLTVVSCGNPTPPSVSAPTDVTVSSGPGYMIVSWAHGGEGVEGFEVHRSTVAGASLTAQQADPIATLGPDERRYKDEDVEPGATYSYSVVTLGGGGKSEPAVQSGGETTLEPGVALVVGTINHPLFTKPVVSVGAYIFLTAEQLAAVSGPVVLTGPPGWNGDAPFQLMTAETVPLDLPFSWFNTNIEAITGEYVMELELGANTVSAEATLDATHIVDRPEDVQLNLAGGELDSATWTVPAGSVSSWVGIFSGTYESPVREYSANTNDETISLSHLDLPAGSYYAAVFSTPWDLTEDAPEHIGQFDLGLSASPMVQSGEPAAVSVTWMTGGTDAEVAFTSTLADAYMAANPHEIGGAAYEVTIEVVKSPTTTGERLDAFRTLLEAQADDVHLLEVDIAWVGDLAEHLVDLSGYPEVEAVVPSHFPAIVETNTAGGRLVGLPLFADVGLLYFRTDLLAKYSFDEPPSTWDELEDMAAVIQAGERTEGNEDFWGYVWQGKAYEGLTVNGLEWIHSNAGGRIVEPEGVVSIDNANAVAALERAAGWVGTISPNEVTTFTEEGSRSVWQQGNAAFMRNWPYAFALSAGGAAAGNFSVTALPAGTAAGAGPTGALGGWQLAVNRYAPNADVAVDIALFAASYENQLARALAGGYLPTIPAVYDDAELLASDFDWLPLLRPSLESAVARPSTVTAPQYAAVSEAFYTAAHDVLTGAQTASDALGELGSDLEALLGMPAGDP